MVLDPNGTEPVLQTEDRLQPGIISDFPEAFIDITGLAKKFKHKIQLKNYVVPVHHKMWNIPIAQRQLLKEEVLNLYEADIIEPVDSSECVSPVLLTRKCNGAICMCVDLRALNSNIVVDCQPLPNISEVLFTLKETRVFIILDLCSA